MIIILAIIISFIIGILIDRLYILYNIEHDIKINNRIEYSTLRNVEITEKKKYALKYFLQKFAFLNFFM